MRISALHITGGHNFFGHHGRPQGDHPVVSPDRVECVAGRGIVGDRFFDHRPDYPGQITFFAEEVHRTLLRELSPAPYSDGAYRRNVITRGIDLTGMIGRRFSVQGVRFQGMAECSPCYWMDKVVTAGAEAWLRGRGGLRAKILSDGSLRVDCPGAAGLLLAGGRSRRMGTDKSALAWQGRPLREHQATTLARSGAWPLLLACRPDQPWTPAGFRRIEDSGAAIGAVGALVNGLAVANRPVLTVLAVDLPLIAADLLGRIADLSRMAGVSVVPLHENGFEPFAAAWHRSALPVLQAVLGEGRPLQEACAILKARGLLESPDLTAGEAVQLLNLNTPADLARAAPGCVAGLPGSACIH